MDSELREYLRIEIERLRRLHLARLRETALTDVDEAPAVWSLQDEVLCWDVVLRDTLEPDIDVEITGDVLVVRARVAHVRDRLLVGVLPVPAEFDCGRPMLRFRAERLEIRIRRRGGA